ncbi:MAG: UbiA family prenyltransferase [Pseudomonadota bacterium]
MESIQPQPAIPQAPPEQRPLVVDLDGTLVRSDLLVESAFSLLKRKPLALFAMLLWTLKGRAFLKQEIARRVELDCALLPFHEEFLQFLRAESQAGRTLVLATASDAKIATAVAEFLGLFKQVLASDGSLNLSGQHKRLALEQAFGAEGFDYAANAQVDLSIWAAAESALLVNPEPGVQQAAEAQGRVTRIFDDRSASKWKLYLRALRAHQWLKNLLLFVPMVLAHKVSDLQLVGQAMVAFLAFSLTASSVYLLNDLLDLEDDRRHPSKRLRPFAAGTLSTLSGTLLIPLLLAAAFALTLTLPGNFLAVLALYYVVTLTYSLRLKQFALVDVLTLCALYTLRIIAGAMAIAILPSFWLLVFSMFLFLSMALAKRVTELQIMQQQGLSTSPGRGYQTRDMETLSQFGSASALMAVLVLALYINSDAVTQLYQYPELIWLLCPLLLYMLTRIWLLTRRGELHEDPVVFLIRDRISQGIALASGLLLWLAA